MKPENLIAKATVRIDSSLDTVWDALVNPSIIEKYMMGAKVESDWEKGSPIVWKGEFKGKKYEDKGKILQIDPKKTLQYTHYSPMGGQPDIPDNYHTVTIELEKDKTGHGVSLSLEQDKNTTEKEQDESEKNWKMMLETLKKTVEK